MNYSGFEVNTARQLGCGKKKAGANPLRFWEGRWLNLVRKCSPFQASELLGCYVPKSSVRNGPCDAIFDLKVCVLISVS